jgi:hypothetical protein
MNKVFLYTYWVMSGEESGDKSPRIGRAWLTSVLPPFYKGVGLSVRAFGKTIRFGICHPRMPVTVDEYTYVGDIDANLGGLAGYHLTESNREIRAWGSSTKREPVSPATETTSSAS